MGRSSSESASRDDERSRSLLEELIDRIGRGRAISAMLAVPIDAHAITAELQSLATGDARIESIVGNDRRVDAIVTARDVTARIVFGQNDAGLVTWLDVYRRPSAFGGIAGGRVVVLNGPSGAGKSTLMLAMQSIATFPLVLFDEPEQIGTVQPGYLIWRDCAPSLHRGYLAAIAALARTGNYAALSAAGHRQREVADAFDGSRFLSVGLRCDLDVLEERERRTGRWAGIAAGSLDVHDGWTYDVEFDTTDRPDPLDLARQVLDQIKSWSAPN